MTEERAQRRLAAILAADVVGYSRLMGEEHERAFGSMSQTSGLDRHALIYTVGLLPDA